MQSQIRNALFARNLFRYQPNMFAIIEILYSRDFKHIWSLLWSDLQSYFTLYIKITASLFEYSPWLQATQSDIMKWTTHSCNHSFQNWVILSCYSQVIFQLSLVSWVDCCTFTTLNVKITISMTFNRIRIVLWFSWPWLFRYYHCSAESKWNW